jgi:hypothetical protein
VDWSLSHILRHLSEHFFHHERLIRFGKRMVEKYFLYLFEDAVLRMARGK